MVTIWSQIHCFSKDNYYVEFLHRVCLHIPDAYESLIRYYGFYSNAARGKRKKLGLEKEEAPNIDVKFVYDSPSEKSCRKSWRQLIYEVFEVDPLTCSNCGSEMKIIAFIRNRDEIIKILKHLNIRPIQYPEPPPKASPIYTELLSKLSASKHLN